MTRMRAKEELLWALDTLYDASARRVLMERSDRYGHRVMLCTLTYPYLGILVQQLKRVVIFEEL